MAEPQENPYEAPVVNNENPDVFAKILQETKNAATKIGIIVAAPFLIGAVVAAANREHFLAVHIAIGGIMITTFAALCPFLHALKKIQSARNTMIRESLDNFSRDLKNLIHKSLSTHFSSQEKSSTPAPPSPDDSHDFSLRR